MLRSNAGVLAVMTLFFILSLGSTSKGKSQPQEIRRSQYLRENKRYIDDYEKGEKRYVSKREEEDSEYRRYKRLEKMYVNQETDEEFFEREKKALYRFTSLQKNTEPPADKSIRLAVIVEDHGTVNGESDARINTEEKEKANLNGERAILKRVSLCLNNKRTVSSKVRVSLNNKRRIFSKDRAGLDTPKT